MENYYYYIAALGLCSFLTQTFVSDFRGANSSIKGIFSFIAGLGFLSFAALVIVLFFKVTWWHPLVLFAATSLIAGFIHPIGKSIAVAIPSAIGVLVCGGLAWMALFH
jgi:CBS domain containing-hemolysin-like protein